MNDLCKTDKYILKKTPKSIQRMDAIKAVINDIMDGATQSILLDKLMGGNYGKRWTETNAKSILYEARVLIANDFQEYVSNAKPILFQKAIDLYSECREVGDRRVALDTLKWISKLSGVEREMENNINIINNTDSISISFGFQDNNNMQDAEIIDVTPNE